MQAHRLMLLAQAQGKADQLSEALFVEQYERGGNISLLETLIRVGHQVGLEGIEPYMQSEQGLQEVVNADQHAKLRDGVHGVPHFVISGPSGRSVCLSGAQAVQTLVKAFEEAVAAPMTD